MVQPRMKHDTTHGGVADVFDSLGTEIKRRWQAAAFNEAAFTDIATEALARHLRSSWVSLDDVLAWVQSAVRLPVQADSPFGNPITVFHDQRFYIDILTWIDGTTSIHEHAFSGAFGVLQGSSLHVGYSFEPERRYCEHLMLGRTERLGAELLSAGDVRPIFAGGRSAHALFHLERPSVSIVIRTPKTMLLPAVQLIYVRSGIAYNPFHNDIERSRVMRSLEIMRELHHPDLRRTARTLIDSRDAVTAFAIAGFLGQKLSHDDYLAFLAEGGFHHRELFDAVAAHAEDIRRERNLVKRRRVVRSGPHRFLLALLMNLDGPGEIKRMVERYAPGCDAVTTLMGWITNLVAEPAVEPGEPNAIGIALGEVELEVLRTLLEGRSDAEILRQFAEQYELVDGQDAELLELCAAFRSSVFFAPLCRL